MRNIKIILEYDGTNYHGWQSQNNAISIQDVVTRSVFELTGENCEIIGCSRTDKGVHALGHVANFYTNSKIPGDKFANALNTKLPDDIVVKGSEEVASDFHARFNAKGKKYRYIFYNNYFASALLRNRTYHIPKKLDVDNMREAAQLFVGTHDFAAFMASGSSVKSTVRTIYSTSVSKVDDTIIFEIEGNGFLYNMVRIMAGTLSEIGYGKIDGSQILELIQNRNRKLLGKTAPPQGLYLVEVFY